MQATPKPRAAATAQAMPAAPAASNPTTITAPAYLLDKTDEDTGEVIQVPAFKYLPGHPRQVRFDAKAGVFNYGGTIAIGKTLSFIPMAWRIFQDNILNMGKKTWAELYFVDAAGAVCAVLFHGYSVENLYRLIEPLFYDDLTLADVVVTVTAEKKQTIKDEKTATYYIATFSYVKAPEQEVAARRDFVRDFPVWRAETYTGLADVKMSQGYSVPEAPEQPAQLEPQVGVSQAAPAAETNTAEAA